MNRIGPLCSALSLACAAWARPAPAAIPDEIFASAFETQAQLTVTDYLNWCKVSVNGAQPTAFPGTYPFTPGTVVSLSADPLTGFIWGYWTGTDGVDPVTHADTSQSTTVTMWVDRSVFVCCPFADGTGCPAP